MKSGICETCGKRLKMVKYPVHVTDGEMFKVVHHDKSCPCTMCNGLEDHECVPNNKPPESHD